MALLMIEGFDKYGPANSNGTAVGTLLAAGEWTTATNSTLSPTIVAPLGPTGFALTWVAQNQTVFKQLPASYGRLIGGFRFSSNLVGTTPAYITFWDVATNQATVVINNNGTIGVRNGSQTGTILGTSSVSVSANSTHYLEFDITFGNSAAYQLWLDGVSILTGTGDTTGTANNNANGFSIGVGIGASLFTVDDFYLFDSTGTVNNAVLLTSPRVETSFPTSDGAMQFGFGAGILGSTVARVTTTNAPAAGSLVLRRFTPAAAGTLASIGVMPGATSAGANYRGVVYGDTAGAAGTLLSSGTQITGVTSGTVATLPLTTPQSLAAGTQYWIGFINDTSVVLAQTDGNALGYRAANTYASGAPSTAPAMTSGQASWLLWGNLTGIAANYDQVNQQPPDGIYSYLLDATVGHEDLYNFAPLSVPPAQVYAVAIKANAAKSDAGTRTVSMRIKSGATDSGGSATGQALGTSFGWLTSLFETNPNGSIAWTGATVNAAQAGFRVDS